ncbi:MAG: 3-phosphoshikimate 1-carboxyvinyltransferase [Candidatus Hydrogenedentes bacterium]|nr:3-phosphoshikimate 1-carboxyvinyltransferase [Candidatus Hydrogenedentota bacterium]
MIPARYVIPARSCNAQSGKGRFRQVNLVCEQSSLHGEVEIPASKSHTIRAVAVAALAGGSSTIRRPLESDDARAAVTAYRALGADIAVTPDAWRVTGFAGRPAVPDNVIDVGNSGTTMRIALGSCALLQAGAAVLTGDDQIRRRSCGPLAQSLNDLGANVRSTRGTGCAPFVASGRLRGGETAIDAVTSQYLSSLLINAPLADGDSLIQVGVLNERPYVDMTLDWMRRQGIAFEQDEWNAFRVPGGQQYRPFDGPIPGDWSSATFFLAAGALGENAVVLHGLDVDDTQGDRAVMDYLRALGADVAVEDGAIRVVAGQLEGCELDLNATPDALPMLAVLGCFARGTTRLVNVPQARMKETDRIAVMCRELARMGGNIQELEDGLVIEESPLHGAHVDGHGDHRVVMALAVAGTAAAGTTTVHGYEAVSITFPGFLDALRRLGGRTHTD